MRIGEVEKLTEVKEANIKFYEREGLINPRRNENGYRDFSDEDYGYEDEYLEGTQAEGTFI